jgi:Tol biopolymer transport system component
VLDTVLTPGTWMHAWGHLHPWIAHSADTRVSRYDVAKRVHERSRAIVGMHYSGPLWSRDDSLLTFFECGPVSCNVAGVRIADGRDTVLFRVIGDSGLVWPSSWSPDGRYLVATRIRQYSANNSEIWMFDTREKKMAPLLAPGFGVLEPAISPDGGWLAYRSQEGGAEIFVQPFLRPGAAQRISVGGGRSPYWRNDGHELLFQSPDGSVMSADVRPGPSLTIATPKVLFAAPAWTRHLFFDAGTSFAMSADARQFTFRMTASAPAAVFVQNWQALLK